MNGIRSKINVTTFYLMEFVQCIQAIVKYAGGILKQLFELAYDLLDRNTKYKSNHISFITRRTTIVTIGRNYEDKENAVANRFKYIDGRLHSELDAIIKFSNKNYKLASCKLWVIRIDRHDKIRLSRPCNRCIRMLASFGMRRVYYSTEEGGFKAL